MFSNIRFYTPLVFSIIFLTLLWTATLKIAAADDVIASSPGNINPVSFSSRSQSACLSDVTVTNTSDGGVGSLRQALVDVCNSGTIDFAAALANQTITLTSAELSITKTVTIANPNAPKLHISGNSAHRIFNLQSGSVVIISHLSLVNGAEPSGGCPTGCGGAILVNGGATLTLNYMLLYNNTASIGGGIYSRGTITINNSTLSGNTSPYGNGGAINNGGNLTINNSTLTGNAAAYGGGIYNFSIMRLTNSIIANSLKGRDCYNVRQINPSYNNIIEDSVCGVAMSNSDPKLGSLQDNGGPTLTHALLPGSPAINTGGSTTCLADDQRNVARPQHGQCDVGAFESLGFGLTRYSTSSQSTPIGAPFPWMLKVKVYSYDSDAYVNDGFITFNAPANGPSTTFAPTTDVVIAADGIASLSVTANALAGGPYSVTASTLGGNSVNFQLTNAKVTPTISVVSSDNPATYGQSVIFTATVASAVGSPTGSVTFNIDGTPQTPVNLVNGQATFSISTFSVGNHSVSVSYGGDGNFNASNGNLTGGQTVQKAASTTAVTASVNPSIYGQTVTFTTAVTANGGTPTGSVTFTLDGTPQTPLSLVNGQATFSTSSLAIGNHSISAAYSGDVNFNVSNDSLAGGQTINDLPTTMTIVTSSANPATYGQSVTFTAIVTSVAGIPTGNITFSLDGTPQIPVNLVNGQATFTTSTLSVGNHSVSADYNGDTNFNASKGMLVGGQTVHKAPSTTLVTSAPNPASFGETVTFTATTSSNVGVPTGSVIFVIDGTAQPEIPLVDGQAKLSTTTLSVGNHAIKANYSGNASLDSSVSTPTNGQTISNFTIYLPVAINMP